MRIELTCYVKDAVSNLQLAAKDVTVKIIPPPRSAKYSSGYYYFSQAVESTVATVDISVISPQGYQDRLIRLRRSYKDKAVFRREINGYLVPVAAQSGWPLYDAGRKMIEQGQWERALVIFEYIFSRLPNPDEPTEFNVDTQFNYGRSALEACKRYSYDTCDLAVSAFGNVEVICTQHRSLCSGWGISNAALSQGQEIVADLKGQEEIGKLLEIYQDARASFSKGGDGYKQAADRLTVILNDYDANADVWTTNGAPKWAVARDLGVSYLKYADFVSSAPQTEDANKRDEFLKTSEEYLHLAEKLGDPTPTTPMNLAIIQSKLSPSALPH
jgi:hypothetical protein